MEGKRCSRHPDQPATAICIRFDRRFCELDFQDRDRPVECLSTGNHCAERPRCLLWVRFKDEQRRRRMESVNPPPPPLPTERWIEVFRGRIEHCNILMTFLTYEQGMHVRLRPAAEGDGFTLTTAESDSLYARDIIDHYMTKWYPDQ